MMVRYSLFSTFPSVATLSRDEKDQLMWKRTLPYLMLCSLAIVLFYLTQQTPAQQAADKAPDAKVIAVATPVNAVKIAASRVVGVTVSE